MANRRSEELRVIVVGAGLMGRHHAKAARFAGAHVVAVVDSNITAARLLASSATGACAFDTLGEALSQANAQAAHVCTPLATHLDIAAQLGAAKIHAFVEKPMGRSLAETQEMLTIFNQAGCVLYPCHQYAFQHGVENAIEAMSKLGRVLRIEIDIRSAGGISDPDRLDAIAGEILPHPISMVQRFLSPSDVGELDWVLNRHSAGEWLVTVRSGGPMITIAISMASRPTCFHTRILCADGTIELDNFHGYSVILRGRPSRIDKIIQPFSRSIRHLGGASANLGRRAITGESAYPGLRPLTKNFYNAICGLSPSSFSAAQILANAAVRDRIMGSLTPLAEM